ncbi:MAG: hypothetical protein L0K74_07445 [Acidipropionibacterium acidipropionici]|nr:hypothetical protein [Acidipropionibacterium acidipropionici]
MGPPPAPPLLRGLIAAAVAHHPGEGRSVPLPEGTDAPVAGQGAEGEDAK